MIRDDILTAELLSDLLRSEPEIEILQQVIGSDTFRYVPRDLFEYRDIEMVRSYLDSLNHYLALELSLGPSLNLHEQRIHGMTAIRVGVSNIDFRHSGLQGVPHHVASSGKRLDLALRCRIDSPHPATACSSSPKTRLACVKSGRSCPSSNESMSFRSKFRPSAARSCSTHT